MSKEIKDIQREYQEAAEWYKKSNALYKEATTELLRLIKACEIALDFYAKMLPGREGAVARTILPKIRRAGE